MRPIQKALFVTMNDSTSVKEQDQTTSTTSSELPKQDLAIKETLEPAKDETETQKLMRQVKDAGVAGIISYALWELGFWLISVPVVLFGYYELMGHWPDLSNSDDMAKLGAEAFAFVNFARFAVPLRIGLALSTTPWIQNNIVDRFMRDKATTQEASADEMLNDATTD